MIVGDVIGTYRVLSKLGEGGMGQVFRARDTKLGREVAIKVLPEAVAADPERVARFEREAKALAALNHPRIATLFGMEHLDGRHVLVMEVVEGPTLAEWIVTADGKRQTADGRQQTAHGLPLDETLAIAIQIAEGLEAAHERGIIHRDLKPANIKISGEPPSVKVLDFGLAKASDPAAGNQHLAAGLTNSPTLSVMATGAGMILGTAAYMSPEQAKGQAADHRSDIFAFGCVLFEMLTGRRAFDPLTDGQSEDDGRDVSEILAAVIRAEPNWAALPSSLHPRLADLLKRCLEKSRRQRWQAIGDVRLELEHIRKHPMPSLPHGTPVATRVVPMWRRAAAAALLLFVGAAATAAVFVARLPAPSSPKAIRFIVPLRDGEGFTGPARRGLAISPDGTEIAYVANQILYVRRLGDLEARPITDVVVGLNSPIYSPDGKWIAFYDGIAQQLKRVPATGGAATTVTRVANNPYDIAWSPAGLLYTTSEGVIRVAEDGGSPTLVAKSEAGEAFGSVDALDGDGFLVTSARGLEGGGNPTNAFDSAQLLVVRSSGERRVLLSGGTGARYLRTGHIVFVRQGVVFAVAFDASRLDISGAAVPVVEGVGRSQAVGQFGISSTGALVYLPGSVTASAGPWQPAVFTGSQSGEPMRIAPQAFVQTVVSPNGMTVALSTENGKDSAIWLYDLAGASTARRLTIGGPARFPVWSPDGTRVAYQLESDTGSAVFIQRADGSDTPVQLTAPASGVAHIPQSWSIDGDHLLFDERSPQRFTLNVWSMKERQATAIPGVESTLHTGATFSPDGRWIAFAIRRPNTRTTVFVQPYPPTGAVYQISPSNTEDGHHPVWSRDGAALLYNPGPGRSIKMVQVRTTPTFVLGAVSDLTVAFLNASPSVPRPFDLLPDGRVAGLQAPAGSPLAEAAPQMVMVLNWFEELKQRVPAAR